MFLSFLLRKKPKIPIIISMRNLTATLCLTLALSLSAIAAAWSNDFQQNQWSAGFKRGWAGVLKKDWSAAVREWMPLAEQGDIHAQYWLGDAYHKGKGVPRDDKIAVKYLRLAAEHGYSRAQWTLGIMYYDGYGVQQDYVYAHMWFNVSAASYVNDDAEGGDGVAKQRLGWSDGVEKKMTPAQIAKAKKLAKECIRKKYKGC